MDVLPAELIESILENVLWADLKSLRQVSKRLSGPTTYLLFSDIHVTGLWDSQNNFNSILSSPELSKHVTKISFGADYEIYRPYLFNWRRGDAAQYMIQAAEQEIRLNAFKGIISETSQFPNINSISIDFSTEESRDISDAVIDFQTVVLATLFASLSPITKLHSLSLKTIQSVKDKTTFTASSVFRSVLARLSKLHLNTTPYSHLEPWPGSTPILALHPWLSAAPALTHLSLTSSEPWGYLPPSSFRSIHFPHLKTLELCNFAFTYDWQFNWILQHAETLEQVLLRDAAIVSFVYGLRAPEEVQGGAVALSDDLQYTTHAWAYARLWPWFFEQCIEKMGRLKRFWFWRGVEGVHSFRDG